MKHILATRYTYTHIHTHTKEFVDCDEVDWEVADQGCAFGCAFDRAGISGK